MLTPLPHKTFGITIRKYGGLFLTFFYKQNVYKTINNLFRICLFALLMYIGFRSYL